MVRNAKVETEDGVVEMPHAQVPWSHWHVRERDAETRGRGLTANLVEVGVAWSAEEKDELVAGRVVEPKRRIATRQCALRGCGGVAPEEVIRQVVSDLSDGGPARLDPKWDEEDALVRIGVEVPSVHVAERTVSDGTLLMA